MRYSQNDISDIFERSNDYYNFNQPKFMRNGIFKLDKSNIKSALVYALLWGLLAVLINIQSVGSVFNLDWKLVVDTGLIALIAAVISVLKNLFTTSSGNFLGVVKVIPETEE